MRFVFSINVLFILLFSLLGCTSPSPPMEPAAQDEPAPDEPVAAEIAPPAEREPVEAAEAGPRNFGQALSESPATALTDITAEPERFAGQTVKTEGEITAVCQRMGCWMEMRAQNGPAIRVPMAGHSFFLPKDVSGRRAVVEGEVAIRELSPGERAHLASEGAQAVGQALQITATGVVVL